MRLRELLEKNPITICPEIYDCVSAKAVEMCGFEVVMISSAELACSVMGNPDLGLLTTDDFVKASYYISRVTPLPLIVDADDCGGSPIRTYDFCKRNVEAGAQGLLILDKDLNNGGLLPIDLACAKFRAAKAAMKGTDCIVIARCDAPISDVDEIIRRCNAYHDAGADMTLALNINGIVDEEVRRSVVERIGREVKGWKCYPDLGAVDGKPDVDVDEIAKLGYNLVGIHYLMYAALEGMLDYGHHIYRDKSNVYFNKSNEKGREFHSAVQLFGLEDDKWPDIEKGFDAPPQIQTCAAKKNFFMNVVQGNKI